MRYNSLFRRALRVQPSRPSLDSAENLGRARRRKSRGGIEETVFARYINSAEWPNGTDIISTAKFVLSNQTEQTFSCSFLRMF